MPAFVRRAAALGFTALLLTVPACRGDAAQYPGPYGKLVAKYVPQVEQATAVGELGQRGREPGAGDRFPQLRLDGLRRIAGRRLLRHLVHER
ncbi:MAG: hypothetical protein H3C62_13950, partial [Gemmatimonadaceae bacterium]|nr:hypothetical protein [Gemmatimonadaceae bacterium]